MKNLKFNIFKAKESDNRLIVSEEQIANARKRAFNINKKLLIINYYTHYYNNWM